MELSYHLSLYLDIPCAKNCGAPIEGLREGAPHLFAHRISRQKMWGRCEQVRILLDNAEPKIGSRRGLEHPRSFQFHLLIAYRLEKSKTFTKEDRDDANMDFVNQPGSEALLSGIGAAYHHDMFVP